MPKLLEPKGEYLIRSGYAGRTAQEMDDDLQENDYLLSQSAYLYPAAFCYEMLCEIVENCSEQGWDGFDAIPIDREVYFKVLSLIHNFPVGIPAPDLVPENDGAITLEWQVNQKQELSVSINKDNVCYFVFIDGSEKRKGSYVLQESLPPFLINMINQIIEH